MKKKELIPNVLVYRDVIPNLNDICSIVKELENSKDIISWKEWEDFGILTHFSMEDLINESNDKNNLIEKRNLFIKQMNDLFYKYYNIYLNEDSDIVRYYNEEKDIYNKDFIIKELSINWDINNVESKNDSWTDSTIDIVKYNIYHKDIILQHHIDDANSPNQPGPHIILSSILYLNDDYENGEISFINEIEETYVKYKPKAGDLLVFPGIKPFYHAAHNFSGNNKYLVRHFLTWNSSGSEDWKIQSNKYGEAGWKELQLYLRKKEEEMGYYTRNVVLPGDKLYKHRYDGKPFFPEKIIESSNDW